MTKATRTRYSAEVRERIRSEAAFAKLCGACPISASSGVTHRYRRFRGGRRQANAALHRIALVRRRWHGPTIAYAARRTADGLSKRDILRCLKRLMPVRFTMPCWRITAATTAAAPSGRRELRRLKRILTLEPLGYLPPAEFETNFTALPRHMTTHVEEAAPT